MGDNVSEFVKIAFSVAVLAVVLSTCVAITLIGQHFSRNVETTVVQPISALADDDAFYLSSYGRAVPIASIWTTLRGLGEANITSFSLYTQNPTNPNDYQLVSNSVYSLPTYMAKKGYFSWWVDSVSGLYTVEVYCLT